MTWRALSDAVTNALSTMPLRAVLRLALVLVPAAMPSESAVGVNDLVDSPSTASYTNKQHKLAIDQGPLYVFLAFDKVWASASVWMSTMRIICNSTPQHHSTMTTCPITSLPRHQLAASPLSPLITTFSSHLQHHSSTPPHHDHLPHHQLAASPVRRVTTFPSSPLFARQPGGQHKPARGPR